MNTRKYSSFTLAAAVAVASLGLTSYALGQSEDPKPGAHNPQMGKGQIKSQRDQSNMQQGSQQQQGGQAQRQQPPPQQQGKQQGAQKQQQGGRQQQAQQGQPGQAPILLGVIVSVPIPVADVALPRGADYEDEIENGDEMRATLAGVTEAALSKGSHADLVGSFVDMDRNRLTDFDERALTTLEGRIDQINQAWQQKYGQQFDIAENVVFQPLAYAEGEITDASAFSERWPVRSGAQAGSSRQGSKAATERMRNQGNIANGREFGVARFPEEHGLPAVNVSFIDEAFGWKIDLPNEVNGQQLRTNLLRHLTAFGERSDQWPASVLEAQRLAAHHVAMALYGIEVPQKLSLR